MEELKYIKFIANESTPLTVLKNGKLKVKDEDKDYVQKGTVVVAALNTIVINHNGKKHSVKVIQTKSGKYAPVKCFDIYVDEFSKMSGDRNVVYKAAVYKENRLIKYGVPTAAVAIGLFIATKRGVKGRNLVLIGLGSLLIGTLPYFHLKNQKQ